MRKLILTILTIITLCSANFTRAADRYVNVFKANGDTTASTIAVGANEVAFIMGSIKNGSINAIVFTDTLYYTMGAVTIDFTQQRIGDFGSKYPISVALAGPGTITIKGMPAGGLDTIWGIKIQPNPNIGGVGQ